MGQRFSSQDALPTSEQLRNAVYGRDAAALEQLLAAGLVSSSVITDETVVDLIHQKWDRRHIVLIAKCMSDEQLALAVATSVTRNYHAAIEDMLQMVRDQSVLKKMRVDSLFPVVCSQGNDHVIAAFLMHRVFDPCNPMALRIVGRRTAAVHPSDTMCLAMLLSAFPYSAEAADEIERLCEVSRRNVEPLLRLLHMYRGPWSRESHKVCSPEFRGLVRVVTYTLTRRKGLSEGDVCNVLSFLPKR